MRRYFRWIGLSLVVAITTGGFGVAVVFWLTPDVGGLADGDPQTTAFIERARSEGLTVAWTPVAYEEISTDFKLAIVVSEDLRFFMHRGLDSHEIRAALWDALRGKRLRGASTITQQLAKNLWLSDDRTLWRKTQEAVLAVKLERQLSKKRILALYLNTAVFGPDVVGVEAAAQRYFAISAAEADPIRAALLAATLPAPTKWFPGSGSPRAARHFERILDRMQWPTGLREEF